MKQKLLILTIVSAVAILVMAASYQNIYYGTFYGDGSNLTGIGGNTNALNSAQQRILAAVITTNGTDGSAKLVPNLVLTNGNVGAVTLASNLTMNGNIFMGNSSVITNTGGSRITALGGNATLLGSGKGKIEADGAGNSSMTGVGGSVIQAVADGTFSATDSLGDLVGGSGGNIQLSTAGGTGQIQGNGIFTGNGSGLTNLNAAANNLPTLTGNNTFTGANTFGSASATSMLLNGPFTFGTWYWWTNLSADSVLSNSLFGVVLKAQTNGLLIGNIPVTDFVTNGMNPAPTEGQFLAYHGNTFVASNGPAGGVTAQTTNDWIFAGTTWNNGLDIPTSGIMLGIDRDTIQGNGATGLGMRRTSLTRPTTLVGGDLLFFLPIAATTTNLTVTLSTNSSPSSLVPCASITLIGPFGTVTPPYTPSETNVLFNKVLAPGTYYTLSAQTTGGTLGGAIFTVTFQYLQ